MQVYHSGELNSACVACRKPRGEAPKNLRVTSIRVVEPGCIYEKHTAGLKLRMAKPIGLDFLRAYMSFGISAGIRLLFWEPVRALHTYMILDRDLSSLLDQYRD